MEQALHTTLRRRVVFTQLLISTPQPDQKADETKAVEMLFEVLKGKETDDKDGNKYNFGCGDEDDSVLSIVSSCMGDCSFDRTSTAVDNKGPAGNDDVDDEQHNETKKDKTTGESLKKPGNL